MNETQPPRGYSATSILAALICAGGVVALCIWATVDDAPRREAYRNRAAAADAYWAAKDRAEAADAAARRRNSAAPATP